jgi:hypothetical protein
MVGLGVIQMARERGIKTINIIRADRYAAGIDVKVFLVYAKVCRPNAENMLRMLTNYGGDINILDSYVSE